MDVDRYQRQSVSQTNNVQVWTSYNASVGLRSSALEHLVPEQVFSTETTQPRGMSSVKAIAIAAEEGQKIYTINKENYERALLNIEIQEEAKREIRTAVLSGLDVYVHEKPVEYFGWIGSGYVMLDKESGAGAYKISSGENGGLLSFAKAVVQEPGIMFPRCKGSFVEQTINNFIDTNAAIWGITAPVGVTIVTAKATADAVGGVTMIQALKLSIKNPFFLAGNFRMALIVSFLNFVFISLAYELGVLIGSAISAAACRKE